MVSLFRENHAPCVFVAVSRPAFMYATYATYAKYISGGNVRTGGMLGGASARAIIAQRRQPLQGVCIT